MRNQAIDEAHYRYLCSERTRDKHIMKRESEC